MILVRLCIPFSDVSSCLIGNVTTSLYWALIGPLTSYTCLIWLGSGPQLLSVAEDITEYRSANNRKVHAHNCY